MSTSVARASINDSQIDRVDRSATICIDVVLPIPLKIYWKKLMLNKQAANLVCASTTSSSTTTTERCWSLVIPCFLLLLAMQDVVTVLSEYDPKGECLTRLIRPLISRNPVFVAKLRYSCMRVTNPMSAALYCSVADAASEPSASQASRLRNIA